MHPSVRNAPFRRENALHGTDEPQAVHPSVRNAPFRRGTRSKRPMNHAPGPCTGAVHWCPHSSVRKIRFPRENALQGTDEPQAVHSSVSKVRLSRGNALQGPDEPRTRALRRSRAPVSALVGP
ncbi:hypothetical protein GCM10011313_07780 [Mycetocola zhadangensis]|nr:hypothetical protein GCM10011313_07780 [Mycetocola zhadangensis]